MKTRNNQPSHAEKYARIIAAFGTQENAAAVLNISRATVNRRLRGRSTVTHEHVMAAENALNNHINI